LNIETKYKAKGVLIIGGAGFIGSNLAHKLVQLGADVTIADIFHPSYGGNIFNLNEIMEYIQLSYTDLGDEYGMRRLVEDKSYIFDLAAQVSYTDSMNIPYVDLDINCRGHLQFLEICREINPCASILFTSSRMVYGKPMMIPVSEEHPTNPLSLYATHKLTGEKYFYLYKHHYGIDSKIVRIANPYGPRNQMKNSKYGILNWFIRLAMENKEIKVFGDGSQLRDYIYIDDIVNGILSVASLVNPTEIIYNLGTGRGTSFSEMVDHVLSVVGKGSKVFIPWPNNYEKNETGDYISDINRLNIIQGYDYKFTGLEEGIAKTLEYYNEHLYSYIYSEPSRELVMK